MNSNYIWWDAGDTEVAKLPTTPWCSQKKSNVKNKWHRDGCVKDIGEGQAGILRELLMVKDLLQQRLFERFPGAAPQLILPPAFCYHTA